MTATSGADDRDLIPRWRPFDLTVKTGELDAAESVARPDVGYALRGLAEARSAFAADPGPHTAADLLAQALSSGERDELIGEASALVIRQSSSPAAQHLARSIVDELHKQDVALESEPSDTDSLRLEVARLRRVVHEEPLNAVRWADMALTHATLGALPAASRGMKTAMALEPHNRFILRAATRLFLLLDEPDRANAALRRTPRTNEDPWLQAAELTTAELTGKAPRSVRVARSLLEQKSIHPAHIAELAAELATLELRGGKLKVARKHMRQALVAPNENAVAQAEWASLHGTDPVDQSILSAPRSFEARARNFAERREYENAVREGLRWQADQPFDRDPAIFISYTASVMLQDWAIAEQAARRGLLANPNDYLLRNNLVFALANSGSLEEARLEQATIVPPDDDTRGLATYQATAGLIEFRSGNVEAGRGAYRSAIEQMRRVDKDHTTMAMLLLAREERLAGTDQAAAALAAALQESRASKLPEVAIWIERLTRH